MAESDQTTHSKTGSATGSTDGSPVHERRGYGDDVGRRFVRVGAAVAVFASVLIVVLVWGEGHFGGRPGWQLLRPALVVAGVVAIAAICLSAMTRPRGR